MQLFTAIQSYIRNNKIGLSILFAAWFVFFLPLLSGKYIYFLDDLKIIYYPIEYEYTQAQTQMQLPVWSNSFGFGHPLIAWGQLGFFTPLHLLLRALSISPLNLLQISVVSYFALGLLGMYVFLRHRSLGQSAAALGATLFAFNGFAIGHLNHVNFYISTMLLPWLLLAAYLLIQKPTIPRTLYIGIVAAATTVSGQPQVVLFVFIAATLLSIGYAIETYWPFSKKVWPILGKLLGYTAIAAIIALLVSAFSVLPLFEFIPDTERVDGLPTYELYEFSYPPWHAVTLIAPYFFGDHDSYWGAKGFQELSAFIGLIPLFLLGIAVSHFRRYKTERIVSILFVVITLVLALGRYSPLYTYLVENHILTSIGVAGRFVYFFTIAAVFLAAIGLEDVSNIIKKKSSSLRYMLSGFAAVLITLAPFIWYTTNTSAVYKEALSHFIAITPTTIVIVLSSTGLLLYACSSRLPNQYRSYIPHLLVGISTLSLVTYAWGYNPRILRSAVDDSLVFIDELQQYNQTHPTPARLYSRLSLIQNTGTPARTESISPALAMYQPIQVHHPRTSCFEIPLQLNGSPQGSITIGLHQDPLQPPLRSVNIDSERAGSIPHNKICFDEIATQVDETYWLSFISQDDSGVVLLQQDTDIEQYQAYLVRTQDPTPEQWERSRKPLTILVEPIYPQGIDADAAILARHINVLADTSSARWIGALSIRNYREFIEFFLANDQEAIDGDGLHAIQRYRNIVNMLGITHLAQVIPPTNTDRMPENDYTVMAQEDIGGRTAVLYENPQAFPKAFMVPNAAWVPSADDTRAQMTDPSFDPARLVYVSGPTPPADIEGIDPQTAAQQALDPSDTFSYTANITSYTPTEVTVEVSTSQDAWLVVSDSTTPQWHTYIDGKAAPQYVGNSVFKTAQIPAGDHTVTFRYDSPAIAKASKAFMLGMAGLLLLLTFSLLSRKQR